MNRIINVLLFSVFIASCYRSNSGESSKNDITVSQYFKSDGVAIFNPIDSCLHQNIVLTDSVGKIYYFINMLEGFIIDSINKSYSLKVIKEIGFNPFELYPEYYVIKMKFDNTSNGRHGVYTSDGDFKQYFIKTEGLSCFIFKSWEDYFIGSLINTDFNSNPIRQEKRDNSSIVVPDWDCREIIFEIIAIEGEWVKIQCANVCDFKCDKKVVGWVRWYKDGKMIISISSTC